MGWTGHALRGLANGEEVDGAIHFAGGVFPGGLEQGGGGLRAVALEHAGGAEDAFDKAGHGGVGGEAGEGRAGLGDFVVGPAHGFGVAFDVGGAGSGASARAARLAAASWARPGSAWMRARTDGVCSMEERR